MSVSFQLIASWKCEDCATENDNVRVTRQNVERIEGEFKFVCVGCGKNINRIRLDSSQERSRW